MARQIGWICLVFAAFAFFADAAQAQFLRPAQRIQRPLRYLGHGNGPGYHTRSPGPNVDYYNPWTQKNSFLISKSPQFLSRYGNDLPRTPIEILQMGSQNWSSQSHFGQQPSYFQSGAAPLSADFVPATPADDDDDFDSGEDEDEGFGELETDDSEFEDRFEEEADSLREKEATEDTDDAVGGFNSLKSTFELPITDEAASLLTPPRLNRPSSIRLPALPASYPTYPVLPVRK